MSRTVQTATRAYMELRCRNVLVAGDPLKPSDTDLIAQTVDLAIGVQPMGEFWHILTGRHDANLWARITYRMELGY